jgi:hypothetical protein
LEKEENTLRSIHNKDISKNLDKKKKKKKNKKPNEKETNTSFYKNNTNIINDIINNQNEKNNQNIIHNNHHGNQHIAKKEVSIEFVKRIHGFIEDFMNSDEIETKIEGLDNIERKYIHVYAEIKNLIHESIVRKKIIYIFVNSKL